MEETADGGEVGYKKILKNTRQNAKNIMSRGKRGRARSDT